MNNKPVTIPTKEPKPEKEVALPFQKKSDTALPFQKKGTKPPFNKQK